MINQYKEAISSEVDKPTTAVLLTHPAVVESAEVTKAAVTLREQNLHYLFVYGTLKQGFNNHHILADSELIALHATLFDHSMIHLGNYPGIFKTWAQSNVRGEIYRINSITLEKCDQLEGVGIGLFTRMKENATEPTGKSYHCWVYKYDTPKKPYLRITSGQWSGPTSAGFESNIGVDTYDPPNKGFGFGNNANYGTVPYRPPLSEREKALLKAKYVTEVDGIFPKSSIMFLPLRKKGT